MQDAKNRQLGTIVQLCWAESLQLRHLSTMGKKLVRLKKQYLLHMSPQYSELRPTSVEICWRVWGTPANFNGFCILSSLLQRRHSREANQTLHDVWPPPGLVHCIYTFSELLPPDGISPHANFTLRPSLAFSYIGSITARHSNDGQGQPNFAAWYKEWNYGTFAEGATYIRHGGHHVGHWPTF